jgi:hypothetical protein
MKPGVVWAAWAARCVVLGRPNTSSIGAPCVLAAHSPSPPSRRRVILIRVLTRQEPLERHVTGLGLRLGERDELVAGNRQAGCFDEAPVLSRAVPRKEHLDAEPLTRPSWVVAGGERVHEPSAWCEPAGTAVDERTEVPAQDVVEDVERAHCVEARVIERGREEVCLDQLGARGMCPGQIELGARDVDAGDTEPLREEQGARLAAPAPELEHAGVVGQAVDEQVEPLESGVALDPSGPVVEDGGHRVVPAGDNCDAWISRTRGHSTSTTSCRAAASARASASTDVSAIAIT